MNLFLSKTCIVLLMLTTVSCSENQTTPAKTQTPATLTDTLGTHGVAEVKTLEGYLDTLYIAKNQIPNFSGKRVVLKYYIESSGLLTLAGWRIRGGRDTYDPQNPASKIILKNGKTSPISFGSGSFLGGVVLTDNQVTLIQRALVDPQNTNLIYLVFAPSNDAAHPGHFQYNLFLSDYPPVKISADSSAPFAIKSLKPINVIANPSPPRNS